VSTKKWGACAAGPAGVVDNVLLLASLCLEVVRHLLEKDDVVEVELAVRVEETSRPKENKVRR
jgi:hypothetical protein